MKYATGLKLTRLMRYALNRAKEYGHPDAEKWRRVFHLALQALCGLIKGELSPERLLELDKSLDGFASYIDTKSEISENSLDNPPHFDKIKLSNHKADGGAGSGNFGHAGRPGKVGGSAPANGGSSSGGPDASSGPSNTANVSGATASPSSGAANSAAQSSSPQDVRKELDARIASGKISTKLDAKKQSPHIVGSGRYNERIAKGEHPSVLEIPENERQAFIDQYIKSGDPQLRRDGSIRIQFEHSSDVGTWSSQDGSKTAKTSYGSIHLSKSGAHIVPEEPKKP